MSHFFNRNALFILESFSFYFITKIKFIDFFPIEGGVYLFESQIDLIPPAEFPLINVTDWFLVRCATGRNRRKYT